MIKLNTIGRPHDTRSTGQLRVNICDHDGVIRLGRDNFEFETHWQPLGRRARVYNDPSGISGVAVVRDTSHWNNLSHTELKALNYSNRTREAGQGEVVVYLNEAGCHLVILITDYTRQDEDHEFVDLTYYTVDESGQRILDSALSQPAEDLMVDTEGNVLTDSAGDAIVVSRLRGSSTVSASVKPPAGGYEAGAYGADSYGGSPLETDDFELYRIAEQSLPGAVEEAIEALEKAAAAASDAPVHGGPGSNNPPPDVLLDDRVRLEVTEALRAMSTGSAAPQDVFTAATVKIREAVSSLLNWVTPLIGEGATAGVKDGTKWAVVSIITTTTLKLLGVLDLASQIAGRIILGG